MSLSFGGWPRTFAVHLPTRATTAPLPVVVNFHGGGSNAAQQRWYSGMDAAADRHGFIAVYPDGTGIKFGQRLLLTFNAGRCCPPAIINDIDDVGLFHAIIGELSCRVAVDRRRVYATGLSNGGMMAHRLAAESPLVAAVASVAGQLNMARFAPARPVPVMQFHSVDDPVAAYGGGLGRPSRGPILRGTFPPVEEGISRWAAYNGCPSAPAVSPAITGVPGSLNEGQSLTVIRYGPGREGSEVVLYKLTGAGHVWPGTTAALPRLLGRPTTLVDANDVMWQFFAAHPLGR